MSTFIIVGLHPTKPTDSGSFTSALTGLNITAYDLTFGDSSQGVQIGTASGLADPYVNLVDITATQVMQAYVDLPQPAPNPPIRVLESAAIAVIVASPPAGHPEYPSADSFDLRLEITRNGQTIADQTIDFNISVVDVAGPLPNLQSGYFAMDLSAYAAIPPAPPSGTLPPAPLTLPSDGTPPNFDDLVTAINKVLADDPTGTDLVGSTPLTMQQCQQIASEITWNRVFYPPPALPRSLGEMYTDPETDPSVKAQDAENDRKTFEAQLAGYYATYNAQAAALANFVFAASAAVACEQQTLNAPSAELPFPLLTGQPGAPVNTAVLLTSTATPPPPTAPLNPPFAVPATFFYALGATLPPTVGLTPAPGPRYNLAVYAPENKTLQEFTTAINAAVITGSEGFLTQTAMPTINIAQAARRLSSLGAVSRALPPVILQAPASTLVTDWLGYTGDTTGIDSGFWTGEVASNEDAYLDLVTQVVTWNYAPLIDAIKRAPTAANPVGLDVTTVADNPGGHHALVELTDSEWTAFFLTMGPSAPNIGLLPPQTQPGSPADRVKAFIHHLQQFFTVPAALVTATPPPGDNIGTLGIPDGDIFAAFTANYAAEGGGTFTFGDAWDQTALSAAVADTFPGDPGAQAWLTQALNAIEALNQMTAFATAELRFSLMEALYARGFTSAADVTALTSADFQSALEGSIAYPWASQIQTAAGGPARPTTPPGSGFQPVNPGSLTDCIPPDHLSPFGPVAYLADMLSASAASTCEQPEDPNVSQQIGTLLADRRGPLGDLHATRANLETPLPAIDLVNESLEALAASVAGGGTGAGGAAFDTSGTDLANLPLRSPGEHEDGDHGLDPDEAFAAIPEHSSSATVNCPPAETAAYAALRADFSAPVLPYDQPLDICRHYLCRMGTSRFAAMLRFRKDITEFVLDPAPADEPAGFQRQLWQYPVRFDIALEYLGISAQEYAALYQQPLGSDPALWQLYGFAAAETGDVSWTDVVTTVPEFLCRTGLSYCDLVELQRCGPVPFTVTTDPGTGQGGGQADTGGGQTETGNQPRAAGRRTRATAAPAPVAPAPAPPEPPVPPAPAAEGQLPECEPCCLENWRIVFPEPADARIGQDTGAALYELIIVIRLWQRLRERAWCELTFCQLAEVITALGLFGGTAAAPATNADFLRQLAALLMLADDLGPDPLRMLPLWATAPDPADWAKAVRLLLDGVARHARRRYECRERGPHFAKIVADNLDPLSRLAGFDPGAATDTWQALPTHTLRFAEVLSKIYASRFTVGEILFLFTALDHLDGDDPFPLPDAHETVNDPLALPETGAADGDGLHSLWALRRALLRAGADENGADEDEAREWTWHRIAAVLRDEFGYLPSGSTDPVAELGNHFFPTMLEQEGLTVGPQAREYRTPLAVADTSPLMWNAEAGPFRYDQAAGELIARLPLRDSVLIGRLRELRQLQGPDQAAVQELCFAPRATLVPFRMIFDNFGAAVNFLVQEESEAERFAFFRRQFARFYARCLVIAEHLADHVDAVLGCSQDRDDGRHDRDRHENHQSHGDDHDEHGHGDHHQHENDDHHEHNHHEHDDHHDEHHDESDYGHHDDDHDHNGHDHDHHGRDDEHHHGRDDEHEHDEHRRHPRPRRRPAAWLVLRSLLADGNFATGPWEDDSGQPPAVTWQPPPIGGAFAALLGLTGTGLLGEYAPVDGSTVWREFRGPLCGFGRVRDEENCPVPAVLPDLGMNLTAQQLRHAGIRNGFAFRDADGEPLGGAARFTVRWTGVLLVERGGEYRFLAGAPGEDEPDFEAAEDNRWRVTLQRGQRILNLLAHGHGEGGGSAARSAPIRLRRGAYQITAEFEQREPALTGDEPCPARTGFEVAYTGPDTRGRVAPIGLHRLFRPFTGTTLGDGLVQSDDASATGLLPAGGSAARFLDGQYAPDLRDIRRTYQRAFKALLLAEGFGLSAHQVRGYRQSELGYLLRNPQQFEGTSYPRTEPSSFGTHNAWFDLDFLPVTDAYPPPLTLPGALTDERGYPTPQRQAALFNWWERLFNYCHLREQTEAARERPPWLLFAEVAEDQPDNPAEMLRHLGVDLRHASLVQAYFAVPEYPLGALDLADERWAVRVWHAEAWLRRLTEYFTPYDISAARPDLWASDDPGAPIGALTGNANLTGFVQDGCLRRGEPRRYGGITELDNGLRERARRALLTYLCAMDRLPLPWAPGQYARYPGDVSDLLLQDTERGLCTRMSRIEDAIRTVQAFVQRARLGLEPSFAVTPPFAKVWEMRFASLHTWQACRRREVYLENWVEWDDLRAARRIEAFRFLDDQLRAAALTVALPGGLLWWPGDRPPEQPSLAELQDREPSGLQLVQSAIDGLGLLGTQERAARPTWLAPMGAATPTQTQSPPGTETVAAAPRARTGSRRRASRAKAVTAGQPPAAAVVAPATAAGTAPAGAQPPPDLPLWLEAAPGLPVQFIRLAAGGIPPASAHTEPTGQDPPCCEECSGDHPPLVDEYYFWLGQASFFSDADVSQDADAGVPVTSDSDETSDWDRPEKLPGLLAWPARPMVHLYWTKVHHGEFEPPRRSSEGLEIPAGPVPALTFMGRTADSLRFEVPGAVAPVGYQDPAAPGFRYDLASDTAVPLPQVVAATPPSATGFPGGLPVYPYFVFVAPGATVEPLTPLAVAFAVANALRGRCHQEAALKWYELAYAPLARDNTWAICDTTRGGEGDDAAPGHTQDVACCPGAPADPAQARDRAVLLAYVETLLHWGDTVLCRGSGEAIQQAEVIFDVLARILGPHPVTVLARDDQSDPQSLSAFQPRPAPLNPRLVSLYEEAADRLALIRRCQDGHRLRIATPRTDRPFWGEINLRNGWRELAGPCEGEPCSGEMCHEDDDDLCCCGPYRFTFLVRYALELANEVRGLAGALLSAFEKGDAEALGALRATHDRQLAELTLAVRQYAWREADWQVQALGMTLQGAQARLRYYQQLIANGLNAGETGYQALTEVSIASRTAGNISEAIAQGVGMAPDMWLGVAGVMGSPLQFNQLPVGVKLASGFSTAARILNALAEIATSSGGLSLTEGGWDRRLTEWQLQVTTIGIEIEQIDRQILAAQRHRDSALRELNSQQRMIEHTAEVQDFLRDKFSNGELYLYLQRDTAVLHRQMYDLTRHAAHRAQRAYNRERGHTARRFLPDPGWDNLHEGLQAGEKLHVALRQMEGAYTDLNCREYELTKHLSLRLDFPLQFLHLLQAGWTEIEIPEWLFDLTNPGHYMRRIKSMTLTIPCVVGPYTGVNCKLTLLSSQTRVHPWLTGPLARCCDECRDRDGGCSCGGRCGDCRKECWRCGCNRDEPADGYVALPADPRIVHEYAATDAIATSSGQNDSGMFELNFRDERYLPFEFAGAVSRWRIELPPENNFFDPDTITDLVLHLNYTAREGGEALRRAASEQAQRHLPGAGVRLFDVRRDLPDAWASLTHPAPGACEAVLPLRLGRGHFPYLPCGRDVQITRLDIFVEMEDPDCRDAQLVRFIAEHEPECGHGEECRCEGTEIECVAGPGCPVLYHGVLEREFPELGRGETWALGELRLSVTGFRIRRLFFACDYQARSRPEQHSIR